MVMEESVKETCLKELGYQIFDQDEKVTAVQVSNNWTVPLADGIAILEKFAKSYENENLYLEYLIRGVAKKAHIVSVVPQAKLKGAESKLDNFSKSLFSVSKSFASNETINYKLEKPKVINIRLDVGQRPVQTYVIPEARPTMEKAKKKPLFAPVEKKVKKEPENRNIPEQKKQETTPKKDDPKGSAESPKKTTTPRKSAEKPQGKGKAVPKIQMGKGSIASFFGNKPAAAATSTSGEAKKKTEDKVLMMEKATIKPNVEEKVPEQEILKPKLELKSPKGAKSSTSSPPVADDSSRKRTLSADVSSESDKKANKKTGKAVEEPSAKKAKKEVKKTKKMEKRSRIMAICDSESDEEEARPTPTTIEDSDNEEIPATPDQDEKRKTSPDENRNPAKKRFKATRKVTKSYQDEDGFIKTVRETEEYSCSEDEVVEVKKEQRPANGIPTTKDESKAPASQKTKLPSKQGNILSFFGKK